MRDFLRKGNKGKGRVANAVAVAPPLIFFEGVDVDDVVEELKNFEDCPSFVL